MKSGVKALGKHCLSCASVLWLFLLCSPAVCAQQLLAPATSPLPDTSQQPALAVTYENGLLTIRANNTSLNAILQQVRAKTGAIIEDTAAGEGQAPVVADFGPGEPAEVVAQLLYGTSWNYAVLGASNDPGKIERILLMPKRAELPEVAKTIVPPAFVAPQQTSAAQAETDEAKNDPAAEDKDKSASADKSDKDSDEQAKDDSDPGKTKSAKKTDAKKADADTDTTKEAASNPDQNATPAFPAGLYRMYPSLFGNQSEVSSAGQTPVTVVPSGNSGNTPSLYSAMGGSGGTGVQADYSGQAPVTPQQFPPELWKLYPPNLVDLIKNAAPPPPIPMPVYVPPGSGVMWDQGISAAPAR